MPVTGVKEPWDPGVNRMKIAARVASVAGAIGVMVSGCQRETVGPKVESYVIASVVGDSVLAQQGAVAGVPVRVVVRTQDGSAVAGASVRFTRVPGVANGPTLQDSLAMTDGDGRAAVGVIGGLPGTTGRVAVSVRDNGATPIEIRVRSVPGLAVASISPATAGVGDTLVIRGNGFGAEPGLVSVRLGPLTATVVAASDSVVRALVPACHAAGAAPVSVRAGGLQGSAAAPVTLLGNTPALRLQPFQVAVVSDTALARGCLSLPADGGRYMLIPTLASAIDDAPSPARVSITYTLSAPTAAAVVAAAAPVVRAPVPGPGSAADALHRRLRAEEAEQAATWPRPPVERPAPYALAPLPALGSTRTFKVIKGLQANSGFNDVQARLAWIGSRVLVYTDAAPTSGVGFSTTEIESVGPLMNDVLHGLAVQAFGPETDLDGNGRVVLLLTEGVNRLTTAASCSSGYIAGYFYSLDLYPGQTGSNGGEVFYAAVPDPSSALGCRLTSAQLRATVPGTFIHEFQHMISFGQHVLLRGGRAEAVWLNEALSHYAEELAGRFYEDRYPPPAGRTSPAQLFPDSAQPFSPPQLQNAYRWFTTLRTASDSPTAYSGGGVGTLPERGGGWLFVRYLATQHGPGIAARLVGTQRTGRANLEAETGRPFPALFGDFVAAVWGDSIPGVPRSQVPTRLTFGPGRNLRQLFARFYTTDSAANAGVPVTYTQRWPVTADSLAVGGSVTGLLLPGIAQYTRFTAPASGPAVSLRLTPLSGGAFPAQTGAQVTVLRLP